MSQSTEPQQKPERHVTASNGGAIRMLLWLGLFTAIGFTISSALGLRGAKENSEESEKATVQAMGLIEPTERHLASGFTDTQGRLLADPPAAGQMIDPQTLVVAHLPESDADDPAISWPKFEANLATATGRKVTDEIYENSSDQLAELKDGKI